MTAELAAAKRSKRAAAVAGSRAWLRPQNLTRSTMPTASSLEIGYSEQSTESTEQLCELARRIRVVASAFAGAERNRLMAYAAKIEAGCDTPTREQASDRFPASPIVAIANRFRGPSRARRPYSAARDVECTLEMIRRLRPAAS